MGVLTCSMFLYPPTTNHDDDGNRNDLGCVINKEKLLFVDDDAICLVLLFFLNGCK